MVYKLLCFSKKKAFSVFDGVHQQMPDWPDRVFNNNFQTT